MDLFFSFIISYVSIVISDFIVHRKIMHGQWKIVKNPHPFFQMWFYPHYIQHIKAHHIHVIQSKDKLLNGEKISKEMKSEIEYKYKNHYWAHLSLICSDHGISIKDIVCLSSFISLFLLTPHYLISLALWKVFGAIAGIISFTIVLFPAFNHIIHSFYHMNKDARKKLSPPYLRWYILNRVFDIVAEQHQLHHYNKKYKDDYYNLLPFGNYIPRPLFKKN